MANERKTETLVRDALRTQGYFSDSTITVEEQRSDVPRIKKLLKLASKAGPAGGSPEFIISSSTHPDLLIVIECKASTSHHESPNHDKYANYAVDGVLLYASYLSREYDVIAVGVSGQTKTELRISHYLFLKGTAGQGSVFGNILLPFNDYYSGYISDPRKFQQDYDALLAYSKDLNETLHAKKIKESQRSLLISGILIALQNRAFEASFKRHNTAQHLANNLVATIIDELSGSDLPPSKLDTIRQGFGFIKTHSTLSRDKVFFHELIDGIDKHINSFRRTHKYFDTLGQFYIEFLRYANNDKGLGIVLTPPHVTELFAMLASITKDSVVFDNACGTGGFLISAMKLMVADAKHDAKTIKKIQKHQLVGIEYQDDIYALSVTNMVLHDDGKSNIHQGDCFAMADFIRERYRPNVGLLNPPYRTEKADKEELEFVLNNLEALEPGGVCVAIVPMASVLAQEGVSLNVKRQLLEKHTLEGVLSMPPDLFHNSKVGVATATIVVTAHSTHPPSKKTWFGYCRDDGFVTMKHRGRVDIQGRWPAIKERWVSAFHNREVIPGFSLMHHVDADDEWCAEAYMDTDYSTLAPNDFEEEVKKYAAFQIMSTPATAQSSQNIRPTQWPTFRLESIFDIKKGKRLTKAKMQDGTTPFIGAIDSNNGLTAFISRPPIHPGNTITVNYNGNGVAEAFYQRQPFWCSDDVNVLYPKFELTPAIALFITTVIRLEKFRFSYGRKWDMDRMRASAIRLPAKRDGSPDWDYMEKYIESFPVSGQIQGNATIGAE